MNTKLTLLRIVAVLAMGIAFAANPLGAQQAQPAATDKTFTGVISDSMCGATHMAKDVSAAECTRMCVKQGQKYALVVGKKVYTLQGHEQELDKLAGQWVTVQVTASGDTLTVSSVTPAKKKGTS